MTRPGEFPATLEWHSGILRADGWHHAVDVHFIAGGWQPYVPATYWQPAEGGLFEDVEFVRAEMVDEDEPPLTEAETAIVRAWFESCEASDLIQCAALSAKPYDGPDPDRARDEAWDRAMDADRFVDEEPF